ncbi:MAG: hypothetical protein KTR25_03195 [Myxococcales bacterium]|nr:hypothetical protein [Myxococcales bacterium]
MLVWLPDDEPDPTVYGIAPPGNEEDREAPLVWLSSSEIVFPFDRPVLDCRSVTRGVVSTAQDQDQLDRFIALRNPASAESLRGKNVEECKTIGCSLQLPNPGLDTEGRIYSARRLEYKWDVALWGNTLYFTRSWGGELQYRAAFEPSAESILVTSMEVPKWEMDDPTYPPASVEFLLRTLVLGEIAAHPFPALLNIMEPEQLAMWAYKTYGCIARFGAFPEGVEPKLVG